METTTTTIPPITGTGTNVNDGTIIRAMIPKTAKTTLVFKSDLRKSQFDSVRPCSGVLHATRITTSAALTVSCREDHAYAWISNYDTIENASAHLANYGFERSNSEFIPYSSRSNWVSQYPHAFPYVDCDKYGRVTGFPFWSPYASNALDIPPEIVQVAMQPSTAAAMTMKRNDGLQSTIKKFGGSGGGINNTNNIRLPEALLTHTERNQLHKEIYNYFVWLSDQVEEMETTAFGRRSVKKVCVHAVELRAIVNKLESAFKFVGSSRNGGGSGQSSTSQQQQQQQKQNQLKKGGTSSNEANSSSPTLPLLEELLVHEMASLASAENEAKKRLRAKVKAESSSSGANVASSTASSLKRKRTEDEDENITTAPDTTTALEFDTMFDALVAYKDEHGSANVSVFGAPRAQLSSWVTGLRMLRRAIDEDSAVKNYDGSTDATLDDDDKDSEGNDAAAPISVAPTTTHDSSESTSMQYVQYLTPERIQRLDSIGFDWSIAPQQPISKPQTKSRSWDERLNDLKEWGDTHEGTFNIPRTTSLGEWLHSQRQMYSKHDAKFMANKAPRMEAIGYIFDLRENNSVSWDERFHQLEKFHEKYGTFDVPPPVPKEEASECEREDMDEKLKFYKWVCRLHNEYRGMLIIDVFKTTFQFTHLNY